MTHMLSVSQYLTDTEDKENLEKERQSLLKFLEECKELLHIKEINNIDVEKFKKDYEIQHSYLFKDELIIRTDFLEDILHFIKTYK